MNLSTNLLVGLESNSLAPFFCAISPFCLVRSPFRNDDDVFACMRHAALHCRRRGRRCSRCFTVLVLRVGAHRWAGPSGALVVRFGSFSRAALVVRYGSFSRAALVVP